MHMIGHVLIGSKLQRRQTKLEEMAVIGEKKTCKDLVWQDGKESSEEKREREIPRKQMQEKQAHLQPSPSGKVLKIEGIRTLDHPVSARSCGLWDCG